MAGEGARMNCGDEARHSSTATNVDEMKLLKDAVRTLPADAVKDLLSMGVCARCIFRIFGIYEHISSHPSLPTPVVTLLLSNKLWCEGDEENDASEKHESPCCRQSSHEFAIEPEICRICMGILGFVYQDEKGMLVKKDCANEFALVITEAVKQEHQQIDSFSLEVSVPALVMEKDEAVWSYMKKKYGSQLAYRGNYVSDCISTKDALKLSIADPLEKLLGIKSTLSSVRIRLTYTNAKESTRRPDIEEINGCKRRKTGKNDDVNTISVSKTSGVQSSTNHRGHEPAESFPNDLEGHEFDYLKHQLEKVLLPSRLVFLCYRCPIYIGGRYLKYSRNVSQTRWIIEDARMGEASVEEIIGGNILPSCKGDSYKFHAAGREDIDVRMLGTGRPFLIEIQNARQVPSGDLINQIEATINNLENKFVRVKNLKVLGSKGWDLMREGEAEKQKQYAALVWVSRSLTDDDLQTLSSVKEMQILQKTPIRVLHRRSPLEREKIIHWIKVEKIPGSSQYFLLHLCTQAGTYIKEFVHGDLGRTCPSVGTILGCRAEIMQLDVTDVKMDSF